MRDTLRILALLLAMLSLTLGYVAVRRFTLPYNEQGRFWNGEVVYERQAIPVYAGLAVVFGLASTGLAMATRRR